MILFMLLCISFYVLLLNMPTEPIHDEFLLNNSRDTSKGIQFYPNMRYRDKEISYTISASCDAGKKLDAERAFSLISGKTVLKFYPLERDGEINVLCADIAPLPEEKGHFVAGEGGPSEIINTSMFAVIFSGKVSLYKKNECSDPNVAIHEILHALGFDHNNDKKSIMYPITQCDQEIDSYIINEINRLYSIESVPDLVIKKITATKTGRRLSFEIEIANFGLHDSNGSVLDVYAEDKLIKEFDLGDIALGIKKILTVENLEVNRDTVDISFRVKTSENELDKTNNNVEMKL